jgi:hypothetical protein
MVTAFLRQQRFEKPAHAPKAPIRKAEGPGKPEEKSQEIPAEKTEE